MIKVEYTGVNDYDPYIKAFIVGGVGKGKTRFSATAQDLLILDAKAGTASIADKNIPRIKIDSSDTLLSAVRLLAQDPADVKEAVGFPVRVASLDTVDELVRILQRERLETTRGETMDGSDWVWLADQMNAILSALADLDMHVMVFSHIKRDGHDDVWMKPDIGGGTATQILQDMDYNLLIDERQVPVIDDDGKRHMERRSFLITQPEPMFEYLKQRTYQLPDMMELNFEDDFERFIDIHAKGRTQSEGEVVEVEVEEHGPAPATSKPTEQPKPSVKDQVVEADRLVAEAERAAKAKAEAQAEVQAVQAKAETKREVKRERLADNGDRESELALVDLSKYSNGDRLELQGDAPRGFELTKEGKIMNVPRVRFVYELDDGVKVLSRNELEEGVKPVPNTDVNTGIFCQSTGIEIEMKDANISHVRVSKFLCEQEFDKTLQERRR